MKKQQAFPEASRRSGAAAVSNKTLVARYDALVQRVQDRVEAAPSSAHRLLLLALMTRLNSRGMRELERRQRASEEQLWKESLFPASLRRDERLSARSTSRPKG